MYPSQLRILQGLVTLGFGLAFVVVVIGAYTRLVDAGLGCPDWPGCYGLITIPQSESELAKAAALYPNSPVDPDKAWVEMIHRYLATGLGILIIGFTFVAWWAKVSLKLPLVLLALVIVQGAFGAWTVTLKLWPQVVTLHLLGGFATLGLLWTYLLQLKVLPTPSLSARLRPHIYALLVVLLVQIALGGWTSSNYAALACPDFPFCHGEFFPAMDFRHGFNIFQDIGPNYLGGLMSSEARVAIQMVHRWGAYTVIVLGVWLVFRLDRQLRALFGGLLVAQFFLGIANIAFDLPLAVATLHNAGAAILLLFVLTLMLGSKPKVNGEEPSMV